jgi:hypothetical protein
MSVLHNAYENIQCMTCRHIYNGEISGSHGSDYEDGCLLGCRAV